LVGYDVIASVVDEFLRRFDADPQLAPFVGGIKAAEGARIRQHLVDFICARTGGPCLYLRREMKSAHEGLKITGFAFDGGIPHFEGAYHHQKVSGTKSGVRVCRRRQGQNAKHCRHGAQVRFAQC
jgi:hemoglobin